MQLEHTGMTAPDLVGIGIGPSNLSLAALMARAPELTGRFFERRPQFSWHDGLLLPTATIQTSPFKDLVTLADPTSPYSFLAFLHVQKRLYRFIHCEFPQVSRREFNQYLQWVSAQLPGLEFGRNVEEVRLHEGAFRVFASGTRVRTATLVLASGLTPICPEAAKPHLGPRVFHGYNFLHTAFKPADATVAVIGGGQTGAEILASLIATSERLPTRVHWISRRYNFLPLDESPFTNELYTPGYSEHFRTWDAETRVRFLREQVLTSDGISESTLREIYRRLYELEFLEGEPARVYLWPARELVGLSAAGSQYELEVLNRADGQRVALTVDYVILCTGARYELPGYLEPLCPRLSKSGSGLAADENFLVHWDGPPGLRIYAQNASCNSHGIADRNLSLLAWRSAKILNHVAGRRIYDLDESGSAIYWSDGPLSDAGREESQATV